MDNDQVAQDLARIAERTRELLEGELGSEEARSFLEDFLVTLDNDPERLRRELQKLAWGSDD